MHIIKLDSRLSLAKLLNEANLTGLAAEIGVWRGDYSIPFLDIWQGKKMYLVDPWMKLDNYDDIRNEEYDPKDMEYVVEQTQKFGDRTELIQSTSYEASFFLPSNLDFVYIDANHSYEHTIQDLNLWWNKLNKGGLLAGHDIFNEAHPGVHKAVFEFMENNNIPCYLIPDYPAHSYFFQKT